MNIKCLSIATDNSHFHQTEKGLLMWRRRSKGAAEVYLHIYFLFHLSVLFWIHNTSVQAFHNLNFASYIGHVSFSQSLSHVRFFLSLRYSPFTAGLLLPFISCLQHRAHRCPSPRYFSQWKKGDETRASCPLFIIFPSLGCLCGPQCGRATTYPSNTSSLRAPFRLVIRRRDWKF